MNNCVLGSVVVGMADILCSYKDLIFLCSSLEVCQLIFLNLFVTQLLATFSITEKQTFKIRFCVAPDLASLEQRELSKSALCVTEL